LKLVGYSNRWSVRPGETLDFFVSSAAGDIRAELVRLIHGDLDPRGPGLRQERIPSPIDAVHRGIAQQIHAGSYAQVKGERLPDSGWSVACWLWPTAPAAGVQGVVTCWRPEEKRGLGLFVADGHLQLWAGDGNSIQRVSASATLAAREWYFVCFGFDVVTGRAFATCRAARRSPLGNRDSDVSLQLASSPHARECDLLFGAGWLKDAGRRGADACYNGKIADAVLLAGIPGPTVLSALQSGGSIAAGLGGEVLADWDFAQDPQSRTLFDRSGNERHGVIVNRPTGAVAGPRFAGDVDRPREAPAQYNALHFHDDDLEDAGWERSFSLDIPQGLRSGVYAVLLSSGEHRDYVPFFVCAPRQRPSARVAVLMPTLTYLAYANESLDMESKLGSLVPLRNRNRDVEAHAYIEEQRLLSTYDVHADGSGVCYASILRPCLGSMRPTQRARARDAAHKLGADLHLIDWLEAKSIPYDVITDHDLHREGAELLGSYRAVMTGVHAEYWTEPMLDALAHYQNAGGRFICLSGNGLYWVTALNDSGTTLEVRRWGGTRAWTCEPGEQTLCLTGEPGGLWRHRGRPPQKYVGVGMAAQGFDRNAPYRRTPASRDPRAAFIFEGVDEELIGDFPALNMTWGAAGFEIDRADAKLGTPPHALILASATGFSDSYQRSIEECELMTPFSGGHDDPQIRADMVFFECPHGGAVFAVGSISWCSTLSYASYSNNVSLILENVVKAFAADGPLPAQARSER
jgi:N,N-dimethylformamidase